MTYVCERCSYSTSLKTDYKKHLQRKYTCAAKFSTKPTIDILYEIIENEKTGYTCDNCQKNFRSASSKSNHKKKCSLKYQHKGIEEKFNEMQEQLDKLQQQIQNTEASVLTTNNDNAKTLNLNVYNVGTNPIINNIGINTNNPVKLREFGNENMDAIPTNFIGSCFLNLKFRDLIENLHYDPDFPENHNIRLKSIKRNVMEIFRDNRWVAVTLAYGIEELVNKTSTIFENYAKKNEKTIYEEDMSEEEFEANMDILLKISNMDKKVIQPIVKDIQLLLESYKDGILVSTS